MQIITFQKQNSGFTENVFYGTEFLVATITHMECYQVENFNKVLSPLSHIQKEIKEKSNCLNHVNCTEF
jgi:hypothetical protein